ncbi:hypothetical protein ACKFKG_00120 [Phormidesmis sp. 146-35]
MSCLLLIQSITAPNSQEGQALQKRLQGLPKIIERSLFKKIA